MSEKHRYKQRRYFIADSLPKKCQASYIGYDEATDEVELRLYNRKQKNEFIKFSKEYPSLCRQTDDDGFGGLWFIIKKSNLVIKTKAPESDETKTRRRKNLENNIKNKSSEVTLI